VVDPDDVEAMADAMHDLLADVERRQALAAAGIARASGFSWRETARNTAAVYHRVLWGEQDR